MQRRSKLASSTVEMLCFLLGHAEGYKKNKEDRLSQLSFETTACQDMSLEAEKLN
jgi:hypothetical protein